MSDRHRSRVVLASGFFWKPSISKLSPRALVLALHIADWTATWNMHGEIEKGTLFNAIARRVATAKPTIARLVAELTQYDGYEWSPPVMLEQSNHYQLNESLISFSRDGNDWDRSDTAKVLVRDGRFCRYCGCECFNDLSFDHVFPRSRGGGDKPDNLVVACTGCNCRKHDRTPDEAGMALLPVPTQKELA